MGFKPSDWPQGYNINQPLIPLISMCFDCLHLSHFAYPGLFSWHLFIVSLVLRGSLVFSVVILVFVLVAQYISLCKCRFLECYLVFLRFTSFIKCWLHFFGCSLFVILFVPLHLCQR